MTLITTTHDSLPYIDRPPSPPSLAAAYALIAAELPLTPGTHHPLLPRLPPSISALPSTPPVALAAISTARYELPGPEESHAPTPAALRTLATASAHLTTRLHALALLEAHGRHAWLVGNDALEEMLRGYEEEVVRVRAEVEDVNRERKRVQEGARARLEGGEAAWRRGVEGLVRVAVEGREGGREGHEGVRTGRVREEGGILP